MTGIERGAGAFTTRVVCTNCLNEYDMEFAVGTEFDTHGFGDERQLVSRSGGLAFQSVKCLRCGAARLKRKLRQS